MMLQKYGIQNPKGQDCRACFQLRFCSGKHRPEDNKPFFLPETFVAMLRQPSAVPVYWPDWSAVTGNVGLGVSFRTMTGWDRWQMHWLQPEPECYRVCLFVRQMVSGFGHHEATMTAITRARYQSDDETENNTTFLFFRSCHIKLTF